MTLSPRAWLYRRFDYLVDRRGWKFWQVTYWLGTGVGLVGGFGVGVVVGELWL